MAKNCIHPAAQRLTIPRSELAGAVVAAKLANIIERELETPVDKTFFYTDSTSNLKYLQNTTRRLQIYVANRCDEVRNLTAIESWSHIQGYENPSDFVTRPQVLTPKSTSQDYDLWFKGPEWLRRPEECWPDLVKVGGDVPDGDEELVRDRIVFAAAFSVEDDARNNFFHFCVKMNSFDRLVRSAAILRRFPWLCKKDVNYGRELSTNELMEAERAVIRTLQRYEFASELKCIEKQKVLTKKSRLFKLCPYVDDHGVLRVGSRLGKLANYIEFISPAIIPETGHITELIIVQTHLRHLHAGVQHVLAQIRQKYWIFCNL